MTDQRRNHRFPLRLPLKVLAPELASGLQGETRNLSSGGVLFTTPALPLALGDSIEYIITLRQTSGPQNDVRLRCVGKIVRKAEASSFAVTLERYEFVRQVE